MHAGSVYVDENGSLDFRQFSFQVTNLLPSANADVDDDV
jgi:hypothetical protein